MTEKEKTKDKILAVANDLFAMKGYDGTSVRDIAKEAQVNLSAINYHFKNKESLYFELFQRNYEWMSQGINELDPDFKLSTEDFAVKIYFYFMDNGSALLNSFKIFLTSSIKVPTDVCGSGDDFGPPGKEAFLKHISNEVDPSVSEEKKHWAMRVLFTTMVHCAIMLQSPAFSSKRQEVPYFRDDQMSESIRDHVRAILQSLK